MKIIDVQHDLEMGRPARSREVLAVLSAVGRRFDATADAVREVAPDEWAVLPPVRSLAVADWGQACRAMVDLDAFLADAQAKVGAVLSGGGVTVRQQLRWSFVGALHTVGAVWRDAYIPGAHYVISPDLPIRPGVCAAVAWRMAAATSATRARHWTDAATVERYREMEDMANALGG